jgi:hypothetical protein
MGDFELVPVTVESRLLGDLEPGTVIRFPGNLTLTSAYIVTNCNLNGFTTVVSNPSFIVTYVFSNLVETTDFIVIGKIEPV